MKFVPLPLLSNLFFYRNRVYQPTPPTHTHTHTHTFSSGSYCSVTFSYEHQYRVAWRNFHVYESFISEQKPTAFIYLKYPVLFEYDQQCEISWNSISLTFLLCVTFSSFFFPKHPQSSDWFCMRIKCSAILPHKWGSSTSR